MVDFRFKLALDHVLKGGRGAIGGFTDMFRKLEIRANSSSGKRASVGKVMFRALRFGRRHQRPVLSMASCQSYQAQDLFRSGFVEGDPLDEDDPFSDRGPLLIRNPGPADSTTSAVDCCLLDENTREESIRSHTSCFSLTFEGGQDEIAHDFGSQSDDFDSQSDELGSQPNALGSQPDDFGSQFNDFESQFDDVNSQFDDFGSQPDDFDSQFDDFSSQFDDIGSQPYYLDSQFDDSGSCSDCDRALAQLRYCHSLNEAGSHSTVVDQAGESHTEHHSQSTFKPVPFELLTTTGVLSTNKLFARKPLPTNNLPRVLLRSLDTFKEVVVDTATPSHHTLSKPDDRHIESEESGGRVARSCLTISPRTSKLCTCCFCQWKAFLAEDWRT